MRPSDTEMAAAKTPQHHLTLKRALKEMAEEGFLPDRSCVLTIEVELTPDGDAMAWAVGHKPDISREAVEDLLSKMGEFGAECFAEELEDMLRALRDELDKAGEAAKEAYDQLLKIDVSSICEHSERDKLYETIFVLEPIAERTARALNKGE